MKALVSHSCGHVEVRRVNGKFENRVNQRKFDKLIKCSICKTEKRVKTKMAIVHSCGHIEEHRYPKKSKKIPWEDQLKSWETRLSSKMCFVCPQIAIEKRVLDILSQHNAVLPTLEGSPELIEWAEQIQYKTFLYYYEEGNSVRTILYLFSLQKSAYIWVNLRKTIKAQLEEDLYAELYGPYPRTTWKRRSKKSRKAFLEEKKRSDY